MMSDNLILVEGSMAQLIPLSTCKPKKVTLEDRIEGKYTSIQNYRLKIIISDHLIYDPIPLGAK